MKNMILGKALCATLWLGGPIVATNALAQSQGGPGPGAGMMGGNGPAWMGAYGAGWMGGYGGLWLPILLVIVVAGLVAWVVTQKGK